MTGARCGQQAPVGIAANEGLMSLASKFLAEKYILQSGTHAYANRRPAAQVRQAKGGPSIAAVCGTQDTEQSCILIYRE